MLESLGYFRTYDRRTFAHAAGEDEGVQIPEHGDERSDIFFRLINEQFNGLSRRHVGNMSLQERPHVGAYLRDAEMGRPIGADMLWQSYCDEARQRIVVCPDSPPSSGAVGSRSTVRSDYDDGTITRRRERPGSHQCLLRLTSPFET